MTGPSDAAAPWGWHGKLPCLGDFASRRLPTAFVRAWDGWLSMAMHDSRRQLADGWIDAYLYAPLWYFVLGPEAVAGAGGWAGVLMSSVDRVGRHYPLTVAQSMNRLPHSELEWRGLLVCLRAVAGAALATLSEDRSIDAFESDLAAVAPTPARGPDGGDPCIAIASACLDALGVVRAGASEDPWVLLNDRLGESAMRGRSVWIEGKDDPLEPPRILLLESLPTPADYARMLAVAPSNAPLADPRV